MRPTAGPPYLTILYQSPGQLRELVVEEAAAVAETGSIKINKMDEVMPVLQPKHATNLRMAKAGTAAKAAVRG